ncbi:MAG: hypothetical protein U1G07_24135 [Verrucomicrobiota bacterium]
MYTTSVEPNLFNGLLEANGMVRLPGRTESAERRLANLVQQARRSLSRFLAEARLTPVYCWMSSPTARVSALSVNANGRFYAVELNSARPLTVAQSWAFALACQQWAENRDLEDGKAAARWERAILKQLRRAEGKWQLHRLD